MALACRVGTLTPAERQYVAERFRALRMADRAFELGIGDWAAVETARADANGALRLIRHRYGKPVAPADFRLPWQR